MRVDIRAQARKALRGQRSRRTEAEFADKHHEKKVHRNWRSSRNARSPAWKTPTRSCTQTSARRGAAKILLPRTKSGVRWRVCTRESPFISQSHAPARHQPGKIPGQSRREELRVR